jgi:hypothetical protein
MKLASEIFLRDCWRDYFLERRDFLEPKNSEEEALVFSV